MMTLYRTTSIATYLLTYLLTGLHIALLAYYFAIFFHNRSLTAMFETSRERKLGVSRFSSCTTRQRSVGGVAKVMSHQFGMP